ncbi:hypothetical protein NK6_463 [Bradyrhizobium diazoefficiens]|uniref:Uncharacterized protein n=1 Tax=Bradyrhizobium diazoefficiens TaxID=1355477 RepID=A0A0E4BJX2_9BRAD|nr:hypothetical protein NK6_463 [Bradyrhizobium diazoefficiens]
MTARVLVPTPEHDRTIARIGRSGTRHSSGTPGVKAVMSQGCGPVRVLWMNALGRFKEHHHGTG